jgi:hypothetical protein
MNRMEFALSVGEKVRALLNDPAFSLRHRMEPQDFTRKRLLPFPVVVLLVLQKSLKSIQLHAQEFLGQLANGGPWQMVTSPAITQARAKLKVSAFEELNEAAVLEPFYAQKELVQLWHGFRLLGIDSAVLRLPTRKDLFEEFGGQVIERPEEGRGTCANLVVQGRLSSLFDCLNGLGLETLLGPYSKNDEQEKIGERLLAQKHLERLHKGDLALMDAGYPAFELLSLTQRTGADFVVRCGSASFKQAQVLLAENVENRSVRTTLHANSQQARLACKEKGLPTSLEVRFVSVRLPSGQLEVLVTSLLEESLYPIEFFKAAYAKRWGEETWFGGLKGLLELENFSGLTREAIMQDIAAAMFISNLETVLSEPAAQELRKSTACCKHPRKMNRAVSLHALKHHIVDLFLGEKPMEEVLEELTRLFKANPVRERPHRAPPRSAPSTARALHHQRHCKKIVF